MSTPPVFDPSQSSGALYPSQKQVFGEYSSDSSSVVTADNTVIPIRVDAHGRLLASTVVVPTNVPLYLRQVISASFNGANIDTSTVWGLDASFIFNVGPEAGSILTGSIALQKNNDGANWLDVTRIAIAVGPGNTVQSGSFPGTVYAENARLNFMYTTGSGTPSITGSYTTKQ